jgi:hypothetical protein
LRLHVFSRVQDDRVSDCVVRLMSMKYCRFQWNGQAQYGLVESVAGRDALSCEFCLRRRKSRMAMWRICARGGSKRLRWRRRYCWRRCVPRRLFAWGGITGNMRRSLVNEVPKEPLLFFKPSSALLAPGGVVRRPQLSERVDYEGELGVVMGTTCYRPAADEDVRPYILGYTCRERCYGSRSAEKR